MALPFLEDVTIVLTVLAICSLIPAQLLFPYREKDFILNKKKFIVAAQILGVVTIIFLLINTYLIISASAL